MSSMCLIFSALFGWLQPFAFISTTVCYHYNSCCCRYCCCCCCDRSAGSNCCHLHKHPPFNWLINLHFVQTVASAAEALLLSRWVCMCDGLPSSCCCNIYDKWLKQLLAAFTFEITAHFDFIWATVARLDHT